MGINCDKKIFTALKILTQTAVRYRNRKTFNRQD